MKPIPGPDSWTAKIHIGNLPDYCSEEIIRKQFSFGKIVDLIVKKNYAFVHFDNEENANRAIHVMNGAQISNKTITVSIARHEVTDKSGRRVVDKIRASRNLIDAKNDDFAQSLSNLSELLGEPGRRKPAAQAPSREESFPGAAVAGQRTGNGLMTNSTSMRK